MNKSGVEFVSQLRARHEIDSDILDCVLDGKSIIDLTTGWNGFQLRTHADVERYLRGYGFDSDDPITNAELLGNLREAIEFIRKHFLQPENPDGLNLELPRRFLELTDIRDLFLFANRTFPGQQTDSQGTLYKNWACSILKVMHTITHVDKDLRAPYFPEIQKQILDRYYKVIHREGAGDLYLSEKEGSRDFDRVKLIQFETKPKKPRDSILIKLLHKSENVAQEVFDRLGIRFVTETKMDALRVIRFLRYATILVPANLKPSRSRNTLVDIPHFRTGLSKLLQEAEEGRVDEVSLERSLEELIRDPAAREGNPFSGATYRAIQFTCRQLIVIRNPIFEEIRGLKNLSKEAQLAEPVRAALDRIDLKHLQREIRFFYPYEVQVTDRASHEENEKGRSAHSEYKKAQVQTALKRVMGSFFDESRSRP